MTYFERGAARRVNRSAAITAAAQELRVEPAAIEAVFKAETPRGSFWDNGVLKCLVEKHYVRRLLPPEKRDEAVRRGLATRSWKDNNYKGEQPNWEARYALLERIADAYGVEIACKSASWGGSQIMGVHHKKLGFETAYDMYQAFADDEQAHIDGFIDYLRSFKVVAALRAKDWDMVALRYNGKGQVKVYSAKMARFYAASKLPKRILEHKPRPDRPAPTPAPPDVPKAEQKPRPTLKRKSLVGQIIEVIIRMFRRN